MAAVIAVDRGFRLLAGPLLTSGFTVVGDAGDGHEAAPTMLARDGELSAARHEPVADLNS
jgi:hypothetical protein